MEKAVFQSVFAIPGGSEYATAEEAMQRLKVRRQTLYAYVSRGWIRSVRQPGLKQRLYLRDDLERVEARSQARAGHAASAAAAMNLGDPIVTTGITEITPAGPSYRGHLATDLAAQGCSFEAVCGLLWDGTPPSPHTAWPVPRPSTSAVAPPIGSCAPERLIEAFARVALSVGSSTARNEGAADALPDPDGEDAARRILQALIAHLGWWRHEGPLDMHRHATLAHAVLAGLSLAETPGHLDVVNQMLILLADHELAPGTLVARVAASGGATLAHCIASALCASSGSQVAQLYADSDRLLEGARSGNELLRRATRLQQRGALVPGFTHYLYPKGDPRARALFRLAMDRVPMTRELEATLGFVEAMAAEMNLFPRHELAMVALCRALGLPNGLPAALLAIARTAGWVAHVREQRRSHVLLRPRARFERAPVPAA